MMHEEPATTLRELDRRIAGVLATQEERIENLEERLKQLEKGPKPKKKESRDWDSISLKEFKKILKGIDWSRIKRDQGEWCMYDFCREVAGTRGLEFVEAFKAEAKRNGIPTDYRSPRMSTTFT